MSPPNEIGAIYENGVLRPEHVLNLPEHTPLVISIRRVGVTDASRAEGRRVFHEIRDKGLLRSDGWRPTRDELHERR